MLAVCIVLVVVACYVLAFLMLTRTRSTATQPSTDADQPSQETSDDMRVEIAESIFEPIMRRTEQFPVWQPTRQRIAEWLRLREMGAGSAQLLADAIDILSDVASQPELMQCLHIEYKVMIWHWNGTVAVD